MKDIKRIAIANIAYDIELIAKKQLDNYLTDINAALHSDNETIREVEVRITEILSERGINKNDLVSKSDIEAVVSQLGEPANFIDETEVESLDQPISRKRLMRDNTNQLIGGVCSGFGAYFNLDANLIRFIAIVLLFITSGGFALIYIAMWILLPTTKTASDRLMMRGQPITLETLSSEATNSTKISNNDHLVLQILRVAGGLMFGAVAIITVIVGVSMATSGSASIFSLGGSELVLVVAAITGIMLFAILNAVISVAIFTKRFDRKIALTIAIIILLGLICFGLSVSTYIYEQQRAPFTPSEIRHDYKGDTF